MELTVIILAGGKSTRMGTDKGLICIHDKPMIQYVIEIATVFTNEIIIISNNTEYKRFGFTVVEDLVKDSGPLAGIYTGLMYSKTESNLILTCDSPFLSTNLIEKLIENRCQNEIVFASLKDKKYPLTALYNKSVLSKIQIQIEKQKLRVRDLLTLTNSFEVKLDDTFAQSMLNLNTPEDLNTNF